MGPSGSPQRIRSLQRDLHLGDNLLIYVYILTLTSWFLWARILIATRSFGVSLKIVKCRDIRSRWLMFFVEFCVLFQGIIHIFKQAFVIVCMACSLRYISLLLSSSNLFLLHIIYKISKCRGQAIL